MTVFVDQSIYRYRRMIMCHMMADSLGELHAMADRIGVDRRHFQGDGKYPHYDICKSKRQQATFVGAVEVTAKEMIKHFRARKAKA